MSIRLCVTGFAACFAMSLGAAMVPGEPAPDLVVRDSSGAAVKVSAYRDKKQIVLLSAPSDRGVADPSATNRLLAPLDTVVLFGDGSAATVLIDRTGFVRRVLDGRTLVGDELKKFVELWQDGKAAFVAYCAPCHGEYGDSIWCDQKPLTGVGQRLSLDEIMQVLHPTPINDEVLIRSMRIKKADLETIIVYLRSL